VLRAHRIGVGTAVLALLLTVFPAAAGASAATSGRAARAGVTASHPNPFDVSTASFNNMRTSWDPSEPGLSPSTVKGSSFGQLFHTSVTGQVYAEPLVIGSTVIVATESNYVYALNASTGAVEWKTGVGPAYKIPNCGNITPYIGITSTQPLGRWHRGRSARSCRSSGRKAATPSSRERPTRRRQRSVSVKWCGHASPVTNAPHRLPRLISSTLPAVETWQMCRREPT